MKFNPTTDVEAREYLEQFDNDLRSVLAMFSLRRKYYGESISEAFHNVLDTLLHIKTKATKDYDKSQEACGGRKIE